MVKIKLTSEQFNDLISESVSKVLDEFTTHQRIRNIKNAQNVYAKGASGYNGIKCFGVMTAENPDSTEAPRQQNKSFQQSLARELKSSNYVWVWQRGHFGGNDEHSMFIFNISAKALAYYSGKYQQTSFIYGELRDGVVHSEYWEKSDINEPYNPKTNPYVKKDESDTYVDASDFDDYSIIGKRFKYQIPFSIFQEVSESVCNNLSVLDEGNRKGAMRIAIEGVGQNAWRYRGLMNKGIVLENME